MKDDHATSPLGRFMSVIVSVLANGGIFMLMALGSSGSENVGEAGAATVTRQNVFCRYIADGKLYQLEVSAANWQDAEEMTCGAHLRDVKLSPLLIDGARLILDQKEPPLLLAQRESCSCSQDERVPILQDIGIIEAPRLGTEAKQTALPRIINTPEPSQENTVTTNPTKPSPKNTKTRNAPSVDDLLNAAADFDEARPITDADVGGSLDGSRSSKSATGKGDPYLQKVKAKLDNTMNAPASIPKSQLQKLSAKVYVKIGDNGTVWGWDFVKRSGNTAFDSMIEKTIKMFMVGGSQRFASPPEQWKLQNITFTVEGKDIH